MPAAIIADAVTLLSNNWNDIRSFTVPTDTRRTVRADDDRLPDGDRRRQEHAVPAAQLGVGADFGTDGGAHNFLRQLEDWDNGRRCNYRGSMVSFFISRQAVGTFKCCDATSTTAARRAAATSTPTS